MLEQEMKLTLQSLCFLKTQGSKEPCALRERKKGNDHLNYHSPPGEKIDSEPEGNKDATF